MACPICGANCQCRKRGEGGMCCSCHKHKARKIFEAVLLTPREKMSEPMARSLELHLRRNEQAEKKQDADRRN